MYKFLVFAGTTEGREIVNYLKNKDIKLHVCVATEYGESLISKAENVTVSSVRLSEEEMEELMNREKFDLVIDTTHPYAVEVSSNIVEACNKTNSEYLRLIRSSEESTLENNTVFVNSIDEAVEFLKDTTGNVLVTTGSKELYKYTKIENYDERLFARVLSTANVVDECSNLGFKGRNLIAMQGPFNEEFNYALLKQISAKYMVTKESGKAGGYDDKISACKRANVIPIIVGRPIEQHGYSYSEVINILEEKFNIYSKRKVRLVAIGMGSLDTMTIGAKKAFEDADIIIGAKRMVDSLSYFNKPTYSSYKYDEILEFIDNHKEYENIVIAYSGDIGFYSGAKKMAHKLEKYDVEMICGISSVVYFTSKLKTTWDDVKLLSMHGKNENIIYEVIHNKKVFSLLGGKDSVNNLCKKLVDNDLGEVKIFIGENLSYENERIVSGLAKEFVNSSFDDLVVVLIENEKSKVIKSYNGIKDSEFIRGEVPMTKEEIRNLSVIKLGLEENSIVYDVGAGTGSVTIEIALNTPKGKVYGIEKNPKGIELININKKKFRVNNLEVIEGVAPEAMINLESPTHAFIGGSSGNLKDIIKLLLDKNPEVKMVVNAITLETLMESMECIKEFNLVDVEFTQVTVAKNRKLGRYNLMTGENPIYIISFKGGN